MPELSEGVPCWGPGGSWRHGECRCTIPDTNAETLLKYGWGFTWGPGFVEQVEPFWACPEHKDDD